MVKSISEDTIRNGPRFCGVGVEEHTIEEEKQLVTFLVKIKAEIMMKIMDHNNVEKKVEKNQTKCFISSFSRSFQTRALFKTSPDLPKSPLEAAARALLFISLNRPALF